MEKKKNRLAQGKSSFTIGTIPTSKLFHSSPQLTRYWGKKFQNPAFHSNSQGGSRRSKFTLIDKTIVHCKIWWLVQSRNFESLDHLKAVLKSECDIQLNRSYLSRLFIRWKWNWKVPLKEQLQKYFAENIFKYCSYLSGISEIPWDYLHFLDESHFESRQLLQRKALSPQKEYKKVFTNEDLTDSYSLTLLTSLTDSKLTHQHIRFSSNDSWDFLDSWWSRNFGNY